MKILIINSGSSSIKFTLFQMDTFSVIAKAVVERIGLSGTHLSYNAFKGVSIEKDINVTDTQDVIKNVVAMLQDKKTGILESVEEIAAIGHRVVHGGENIFPNVSQVAVFDTAFHTTIPEHIFLYGLPYRFYLEDKIRRYGFHGTSHQYISKKAAKIMGRPLKTLKIVSCHLGNGSSITAVDGGKSLDTSMGMTPLEGLLMGTRCGDIDPAVIFYLINDKGFTYCSNNTLDLGFKGQWQM